MPTAYTQNFYHAVFSTKHRAEGVVADRPEAAENLPSAAVKCSASAHLDLATAAAG
jgi:hypothetical protein